MIRCLILEDEKPAQDVLQTYVDKTPFIECIGVYESGLDIPHDKISIADVIFLDIQLPEINGLSFIKTLDSPPKVIVTSAYSYYAIEAFEENVVDYLVKPFAYERFFKAVSRLRNQVQIDQKEKFKQVFLYSDKTLYKVSVDDILFLKAEVDYVSVVTTERSILILDSLRNWVDKLYDFNFAQTHRSYIVNIDKIEKLSGNQVFISNEAIPIGKVYKDKFYERIGYQK